MYHSEKKASSWCIFGSATCSSTSKSKRSTNSIRKPSSRHGEEVEWSDSDAPDQPLEISEWKERNVGRLLRVSFRLGKDGHILELQIPLKPDGKPMY